MKAFTQAGRKLLAVLRLQFVRVGEAVLMDHNLISPDKEEVVLSTGFTRITPKPTLDVIDHRRVIHSHGRPALAPRHRSIGAMGFQVIQQAISPHPL